MGGSSRPTGTPSASAMAPPEPHEAIYFCRRYLANAQQQLAAAQTREERMDAELWVDNAQRNLDKWQRALERTVGA